MTKFTRGVNRKVEHMKLEPNDVDRIDIIPYVVDFYDSLKKQMVYTYDKFNKDDILNLRKKYNHTFKNYLELDTWNELSHISSEYRHGCTYNYQYDYIFEVLVVLIFEQKCHFLTYLKMNGISFDNMVEVYFHDTYRNGLGTIYSRVVGLYIYLNTCRFCNKPVTYDGLTDHILWTYFKDCLPIAYTYFKGIDWRKDDNKINNERIKDEIHKLNSNNDLMDYLLNVLVTIRTLVDGSVIDKYFWEFIEKKYAFSYESYTQ